MTRQVIPIARTKFGAHLDNCAECRRVAARFPDLELFDHQLCPEGRVLFRAPSTEQPASAAGSECGFDEAWIGKCKQVGNPRCPKHTGRACTSCGADATRNCPETGQFVCGVDLCDGCEHATFPDGTNGGVGFNAQSLSEGMKSHCKKTEQKFQPWYMQEERKPPAPAAQETGEDGSRRYLKSELAYALAEVQSLSAERERLREVNQKLVEALQFIKAFFNRLEHDGDEDDPLTAARQRFHAPVHAAIDAALNEQGKESG